MQSYFSFYSYSQGKKKGVGLCCSRHAINEVHLTWAVCGTDKAFQKFDKMGKSSF